MSDVILELLVILVLVSIEAVFVAAEIALVTIRTSRVEQLIDEGHRGARLVRRLTQDPSRFLAVIQVAITFVGFLSSAYAAVNLTTRLDTFLQPAIGGAAGGVALLLITILLAAFTIVFAELVPKTLALAHTDRYALALAVPVDLTGRLLSPVVALLSWLTRVIAAGFGADVQKRAQISTEELKLIVERGGEEGILEAEEEQMISAVIELGERRLHEVMVPRTEMTALPLSATLDEALDCFISGGHSRIPVYKRSVDEIIGVLYAKDLLPFLKGGAPVKRPDWHNLLRTPLFAPESMSIDDLLHKLQRRKVHLAIVLDEYGGTAGLVSIEDLLEEIVGEIQDEYDAEEPMIVRLSDDQARIDGRASVDDLGELFGVELSELEDAEEYDTIGGLVYHRVGGVPKPGDRIESAEHGLTLTVETTDGRRVGKVLAVREPRGKEGETEGD
jgi:putative hemolysin